MASLFKRGDIYWIRYKQGGKWRSISTGCRKKIEAEQVQYKYASIELNQRHHLPIRTISASATELLKDFRDNALKIGDNGSKEESSIKREKAIVNNLISWLDGLEINKVHDITSDMVYSLIWDTLPALGRSSATCIETLRILKKFFKWTISKSYIHTNPAADIKNPHKENKAPRFFTEDELQKIFNASDEPYKSIFQFLYLTGLRVGELRNLRFNDYNPNTRQITVRLMPGNKTKRETKVPLNEQAITIIEQQRKAHDEPFVFVNSNDAQYKPDHVRKYLLKICKQEKIPNATTHTLRHTCASHLVQMGVSLYVVKEILRHKSIRETEIYAHLADDTTRKAVDLLTI
jgi:site-specific recombinase XerD